MTVEENIEMLKKDKEQRGKCFISEALDFAIEVIENTRWIPVSEDLPKESGVYFVTILTTLFDKNGKNPVREVRRDYFSILSKEWLYENDDIVAWMPQLEPYKG